MAPVGLQVESAVVAKPCFTHIIKLFIYLTLMTQTTNIHVSNKSDPWLLILFMHASYSSFRSVCNTNRHQNFNLTWFSSNNHFSTW